MGTLIPYLSKPLGFSVTLEERKDSRIDAVGKKPLSISSSGKENNFMEVVLSFSFIDLTSELPRKPDLSAFLTFVSVFVSRVIPFRLDLLDK